MNTFEKSEEMTLKEIKRGFSNQDYIRGEAFDARNDEYWIQLKSGSVVCLDAQQIRARMNGRLNFQRRYADLIMYVLVPTFLLVALFGLIAAMICEMIKRLH